MLQPLKKQSKKLILLKHKLIYFITRQLWVYILVLATTALCAWIFNRWIEGTMFCIAHVVIRREFDRQFHFNKTAYGISLTLAILWFAIPITLPIATSLLSSIVIAFLICFIGFIAQDRLDKTKQIGELKTYINNLLAQISHKDIYTMSEQELYEHCRSRGLSDVDCKIAYYVVYERLKGQELYDAINYSERQAKRKRAQILGIIK